MTRPERREHRVISTVGAITLTCVLARPAGAQPAQGPRNPAAATALFKEALALIDGGDWAGGCPKFEASLALNPTASTQINVARCHVHEGKPAQALADYRNALVLNAETGDVERRKALEAIAKKELAAIEPPERRPLETREMVPPGRAWQRPAGIVAMALGITGIGAGAVLGALAIARNGKSNADNHCDAKDRCDTTGLGLRNQALALGNGSTAAIVTGGVALAGGVVLFATAPAERANERIGVKVMLLPGGVSVQGLW
jgi:hypothetical protein